MKLCRLVLTGFGKFVGRQIELKDGLNVFYGLNESGKTTIQHFLKGMLFGFKEPDARRRRWTPELDRYAPWSGQPYAGSLEFTTQDGRMYRVERLFAKERDRVRVFDAITGKDISSTFEIDKRRELLFAEKFLGMNELVFSNTVCIGDMPDVTNEKGCKELAARLSNLQESADEATSVRRAADVLEATRRSLVTRYNQLQKSVDENRQALSTILGHRAALRSLELELREVEKAQAVQEVLQRQAATALLQLDIAELEQKHAKACALEREISQLRDEVAALAPYAKVPRHLLEQAKRLETRIEEGLGGLQLVNTDISSLQDQLASVERELIALPGAEGLVPAFEADATYGEEARSIVARLTETLQYLNESGERLRQAEHRVKEATAEMSAYEGLDSLPTTAPQLLAELDACYRGATALSESWQALARRRRALAERLHAYEDRVRALLRQLDDLAIVAALPENAGRQIEALLVEVQALTRSMDDTLRARAGLLERTKELERRLTDFQRLTNLPPDVEVHVQELQLRIHSGRQRVAALRTLVDQLQVAVNRQNRLAGVLKRLKDEIGRSERLAGVTLTEVHAAESWLLRWSSAKETIAEATAVLEEVTAQQATIQEALVPLQEVGEAGVEGLARAEQLTKQEAEARARVQKAANAVDALEDPPSGLGRLGIGLLTGGVGLGIAAKLQGWSAIWPWAGLVVAGFGVPLLVMALLRSARVGAERNRLYSTRREAVGVAEKINSELRPLLAAVRQPSVAAWGEAWQRYRSLQTELTGIEHKVKLAHSRLSEAEKAIAEARGAVLPLLRLTGVEEVDLASGPDKVAKALAGLAEALLARQSQLRERATVRMELDGARQQVISTYRDTVDAVSQLFPSEQVPPEPSLAWGQDLMRRATSVVDTATSELASLLATAGVESPAELLQRYRERHALGLRHESLQRDIEEREGGLSDIIARRNTVVKKVLQLLELAGVSPASYETAATANSQDHGAAILGLPWTDSDIETFRWRLRRYGELHRQAEALPQELPGILRDTEQLLEETSSSERLSRELQGRLDSALRLLPPSVEPSVLAAAATEEVQAEGNGVLTAVGTGLPAVFWPEGLDNLLASLASAGSMDKWRRTMMQIRGTARSALAAVRATAEAESNEEFHQRWEEYSRVHRALGEKQQLADSQRGILERQLAHATQLLNSEAGPLLAAAGVVVPELLSTEGGLTGCDDVAVAAWQEALLQAVERVDMVQGHYAQSEEIRAKLGEKKREQAEREQALAGLEAELLALLAECTKGSVEELEAACQLQAAWQQAVFACEGREEQLSALMGNNTTLAEITSQLEAKQEERRALQGEIGEFVPESRDRLHWTGQLESAETGLALLREKRAEMYGDMKSHTSYCEGEERVVAELESKLGELNRVQRALAALQLARQELDLASEEVHRQFAPALNAHASDILHSLTQGRYEQLAVSETLDITLTDPEFERQVGLDAVSHGTCDQVYLAFRLAAAQAICGDSWAPPLILDDAFAHYDDNRACEALETLLRIAERTQVLFFTCRWREVELVRELSVQTGINYQLIELGDTT